MTKRDWIKFTIAVSVFGISCWGMAFSLVVALTVGIKAAVILWGSSLVLGFAVVWFMKRESEKGDRC